MKTSEIFTRAAEIASKPLPILNANALTSAINELKAKTKRSAELTERAKKVLPNGSQHTLPLSNPYPFFMQKGTGSLLLDVDGNEYTDYILSGGAIILGHNDPGLIQSIQELLSTKTHFHGHFDELELDAADEVISFFPSIEKVRFTASGSEANNAAIKIARAVTGKKKLIKFLGHYHGWGHEYLMDVEVPGSGKFVTNGIPDEYMDQTILVPPNDLEKLEDVFRAHQADGGIAAIIIEPYGAESGLVPIVEGFNEAALEMAHRYGALYIMDEVVTGFRLGKGGAQKRLGVMPDLTTLGKGLMNGFPSCGAVGGKSEIMDAANVSIPYSAPYTYVAGTLSGNALSVAACKHVVSTLATTNRLEHAEAMAVDVVTKLNALFMSYQSDFFAYNIGNILRVELTAPHAVPLTSQEALMEVVARRQILSSYSAIVASTGVLSRHGRDFVSCAHTVQDNDRYVAGYEKLLQSFSR
jgi:glutamate-1-semialdehyde aminotransferase